MPGFLLILCSDLPPDFDVETPTPPSVVCVERRLTREGVWLKSNVLSKFLKDKVFEGDHYVFVCTDGVLLNTGQLRARLDKASNFELLAQLYSEGGISAVSRLRGSFSGIIYDGKENVWHVFTDHLGTKPVFYFVDESRRCVVISSELKMLLHAIRHLGYSPKLCEVGAYCLLTFGFMLGDYTYVEDVKRLPAGCVLTIKDNVAHLTQYYKLASTPYLDEPKNTMIEELDRRFRAAVNDEYQKDLEYGYKHIATLSGGLDSRMSLTYAKQLGYSDILTITLSQANYWDEKIAKKISADYRYQFLFYGLDNGNYLKDIEKPVSANDGLVLFPGSAHLLAMESLIDWQRLGILHTGMIGDFVMGSYLYRPSHSSPGARSVRKIAYSTKLLKKIPVRVVEKEQQRFENDELFSFYERCLNGAWNGFWTTHQFTEATSPFVHIDFLDYVMRIPPRFRYREKIYQSWIRKFASEASKYRWEKTGMRIGAPRAITFTRQALRYLKSRMGASSYSMNPEDYWYRTNETLRTTFKTSFERDITYLHEYPKLKDDVAYLFQNGTLLEKGQCLTLLEAIRLFLFDGR
jgi:asparagine synthase (glutamine-hydrolysing)